MLESWEDAPIFRLEEPSDRTIRARNVAEVLRRATDISLSWASTETGHELHVVIDYKTLSPYEPRCS